MPSMCDLDRYVTLHRTRGVIHIHAPIVTNEKGDVKKQRGHFRVYTKKQVQWIIGNSRVRYVYPPKKSFYGTFRKCWPLGKEEYDDKKRKSLTDYAQPDSRTEQYSKRNELRLASLVDWVKTRYPKVTYAQMSEEIGINERTLRQIRTKVRKNAHLPNEEGSEKGI